MHHADLSRFLSSFHLLNLGILILLDLVGEKKISMRFWFVLRCDISISMILFDFSVRKTWVSGMSEKYGSRYEGVNFCLNISGITRSSTFICYCSSWRPWHEARQSPKDKPVSGILESRRWNDCWRHAAINVSPIYINCSKANWSCHFDRGEETQCHSKTGCMVEWVTSMFKGNYHFKFLTKKMGSSKFRSTINLSLTLFVSVVHAWLR